MKAELKTKVSITVSSGLLAELDREAAKKRSSRSAVIEDWLRLAKRKNAQAELDEETIAYYLSRTPEERAEDEAIAKASSRAFRKLRIE